MWTIPTVVDQVYTSGDQTAVSNTMRITQTEDGTAGHLTQLAIHVQRGGHGASGGPPGRRPFAVHR